MTAPINELISQGEMIGTIGSPSETGDIVIDILGRAATRKLMGEVVIFKFIQDAAHHCALGQLTAVQLRNVWLENPTIKSIARQRGTVQPVSGHQDVHTGHLKVTAVFRVSDGILSQSLLGTIPPTGTTVHVVTDEILNALLTGYGKQVFYLGRVYGSTPKLPMWFKHFGQGAGGAGEAYHLGIFGRTGSGKSVLAKMVVLAYSRHTQMGIIIFDPQGEFAKGLLQNENELVPQTMGDILCPRVLSAVNRKYSVYHLGNIALSGWDLFVQLLTEFRFFVEMGIKLPEYQDIAADYLREYLLSVQRKRQNGDAATVTALTERDVFEAVLEFLSGKIERIYSGDAYVRKIRDRITECRERLRTGETDRLFDLWRRTAEFFKTEGERKSVEQIIRQVITAGAERPLVVIDLSGTPQGVSPSIWEDRIKPLIIEHFLKVLIDRAEVCYRGGSGLNTLVVIDEAQRLAPAGAIDDPRRERICRMIVDAVRTTRKYELGWMFISQTLSSLHREIVEQLRICFFGYGLVLGSEKQALTNLLGNDDRALELYLSFRDPHSALTSALREYPFMTVGPVSPLSFQGAPLFFTAFSSAREFLQVNGLLSQSQRWSTKHTTPTE